MNDKKEFDFFLLSQNNKDVAVADYRQQGFSGENVQMLSPEEYKKSQKVQNMFKTKEGNFDEKAFEDAYKKSIYEYNRLVNPDETYPEIFSYYQPEAFLPSKNNRQKYVINRPLTMGIMSVNPFEQNKGVAGINVISEPTKTVSEIAQHQYIYDPKENKFLNKTPEDLGLKYVFDDTLILATWDEKGTHKNELGEEVEHQKGEYKYDETGKPYYEYARGKSTLGKQVLSVGNILTREDTQINTYDFIDSDDKQKSIAGTIVKNGIWAAAHFIPGVNYAALAFDVLQFAPAVAGIGYGLLNAADTGVGKITGTNFIKDVEPQWLTTWKGITDKNLTVGVSEYSQQNLFTWENMIGLVGDVVVQLKGQNMIYKLGSRGYEKKVAKQVEKQWAKFADKLDDAVDIAGATSKSVKTGIPQVVFEGMPLPYTKEQLKEVVTRSIKMEANFAPHSTTGEMASKWYMAIMSGADSYWDAREAGWNSDMAGVIGLSMVGMYRKILDLPYAEWVFPNKELNILALRKTISDVVKDTKIVDAGMKAAMKKTPKAMSAFQKTLTGTVESSYKQNLKWYQKFLNKFKRTKSFDKAIESKDKKFVNGIKLFFSNAGAEALEETTEQLAQDMIYQGFSFLYDTYTGKTHDDLNLASWHKGNMFQTYLMNALGGAMGGAIGGITGVRNLHKIYKGNGNADQNLIAAIRNGQKEDLISEIRKIQKKSKGDMGGFGSNVLSAEVDEKASTADEYVFKPVSVSENRVSQNQVVADALVNQIEVIDEIINSENLDLTDQDVIKKTLQKELMFSQIWGYSENSPVFTQLLRDFDRLSREIVQTRLELSSLEPETDLQKRNQEKEDKNEFSTDVKRKFLEKKLAALREERSNWIEGGNRTEKYASLAIYSMMPALRDVAVNVREFAKFRYNVDYDDDISEENRKYIDTEYEHFVNNGGIDLLIAEHKAFTDANQKVSDSIPLALNWRSAFRMANEFISDSVNDMVGSLEEKGVLSTEEAEKFKREGHGGYDLIKIMSLIQGKENSSDIAKDLLLIISEKVNKLYTRELPAEVNNIVLKLIDQFSEVISNRFSIQGVKNSEDLIQLQNAKYISKNSAVTKSDVLAWTMFQAMMQLDEESRNKIFGNEQLSESANPSVINYAIYQIKNLITKEVEISEEDKNTLATYLINGLFGNENIYQQKRDEVRQLIDNAFSSKDFNFFIKNYIGFLETNEKYEVFVNEVLNNQYLRAIMTAKKISMENFGGELINGYDYQNLSDLAKSLSDFTINIGNISSFLENTNPDNLFGLFRSFSTLLTSKDNQNDRVGFFTQLFNDFSYIFNPTFNAEATKAINDSQDLESEEEKELDTLTTDSLTEQLENAKKKFEEEKSNKNKEIKDFKNNKNAKSLYLLQKLFNENAKTSVYGRLKTYSDKNKKLLFDLFEKYKIFDGEELSIDNFIEKFNDQEFLNSFKENHIYNEESELSKLLKQYSDYRKNQKAIEGLDKKIADISEKLISISNNKFVSVDEINKRTSENSIEASEDIKEVFTDKTFTKEDKAQIREAINNLQDKTSEESEEVKTPSLIENILKALSTDVNFLDVYKTFHKKLTETPSLEEMVFTPEEAINAKRLYDILNTVRKVLIASTTTDSKIFGTNYGYNFTVNKLTENLRNSGLKTQTSELLTLSEEDAYLIMDYLRDMQANLAMTIRLSNYNTNNILNFVPKTRLAVYSTYAKNLYTFAKSKNIDIDEEYNEVWLDEIKSLDIDNDYNSKEKQQTVYKAFESIANSIRKHFNGKDNSEIAEEILDYVSNTTEGSTNIDNIHQELLRSVSGNISPEYSESTAHDKAQLLLTIATTSAADIKTIYDEIIEFGEVYPTSEQLEIIKGNIGFINNSELWNIYLEKLYNQTWLKEKKSPREVQNPLYKNIRFIDSGAGAGKTQSVVRTTINIALKAGKKIAVIGTVDKHINRIKESLQSNPNVNYNNSAISELRDIYPHTNGEEKNGLTAKNDSEVIYNKKSQTYEIVTPNDGKSFKELTGQSDPLDGIDIIIIDEATYLSQSDLVMLSHYAEMTGKTLLLFGDTHQAGNPSGLKLTSKVGTPLNKSTRIDSNYRSGSRVKRNNQSLINKIIYDFEKSLSKSPVSEVSDYKDSTLVRSVVLEWNQSNKQGDKFINKSDIDNVLNISKDNEFTYAISYDSDDSKKKAEDLKEQLKQKGIDEYKITVISQQDIQGSEFDYVFSYANLSLDGDLVQSDLEVFNVLNMLLTRSKKGTFIINEGNLNLISKETKQDSTFNLFENLPTAAKENFLEQNKMIDELAEEEKIDKEENPDGNQQDPSNNGGGKQSKTSKKTTQSLEFNNAGHIIGSGESTNGSTQTGKGSKQTSKNQSNKKPRKGTVSIESPSTSKDPGSDERKNNFKNNLQKDAKNNNNTEPNVYQINSSIVTLGIPKNSYHGTTNSLSSIVKNITDKFNGKIAYDAVAYSLLTGNSFDLDNFLVFRNKLIKGFYNILSEEENKQNIREYFESFIDKNVYPNIEKIYISIEGGSDSQHSETLEDVGNGNDFLNSLTINIVKDGKTYKFSIGKFTNINTLKEFFEKDITNQQKFYNNVFENEYRRTIYLDTVDKIKSAFPHNLNLDFGRKPYFQNYDNTLEKEIDYENTDPRQVVKFDDNVYLVTSEFFNPNNSGNRLFKELSINKNTPRQFLIKFYHSKSVDLSGKDLLKEYFGENPDVRAILMSRKQILKPEFDQIFENILNEINETIGGIGQGPLTEATKQALRSKAKTIPRIFTAQNMLDIFTEMFDYIEKNLSDTNNKSTAELYYNIINNILSFEENQKNNNPLNTKKAVTKENLNELKGKLNALENDLNDGNPTVLDIIDLPTFLYNVIYFSNSGKELTVNWELVSRTLKTFCSDSNRHFYYEAYISKSDIDQTGVYKAIIPADKIFMKGKPTGEQFYLDVNPFFDSNNDFKDSYFYKKESKKQTNNEPEKKKLEIEKNKIGKDSEGLMGIKDALYYNYEGNTLPITETPENFDFTDFNNNPNKYDVIIEKTGKDFSGVQIKEQQTTPVEEQSELNYTDEEKKVAIDKINKGSIDSKIEIITDTNGNPIDYKYNGNSIPINSIVFFQIKLDDLLDHLNDNKKSNGFLKNVMGLPLTGLSIYNILEVVSGKINLRNCLWIDDNDLSHKKEGNKILDEIERELNILSKKRENCG